MTAPIDGIRPPIVPSSPPRPAPLESGGGRFAELLHADSGGSPASVPLADVLRETAGRLAADQRYVDGVVARLRRGGVVDSAELLSLQAGVYRYSQEIELATRVVDKATNAIRQTVQSQG